MVTYILDTLRYREGALASVWLTLGGANQGLLLTATFTSQRPILLSILMALCNGFLLSMIGMHCQPSPRLHQCYSKLSRVGCGHCLRRKNCCCSRHQPHLHSKVNLYLLEQVSGPHSNSDGCSYSILWPSLQQKSSCCRARSP